LLAWLLWSVAHIYFLIGFRSRLAVAINWGWSYPTYQRRTLITGVSGARMEGMPMPDGYLDASTEMVGEPLA
jgi:NADH:ubiquinone reductase (H+-translocating)